jgi:hypothetical protein
MGESDCECSMKMKGNKGKREAGRRGTQGAGPFSRPRRTSLFLHSLASPAKCTALTPDVFFLFSPLHHRQLESKLDIHQGQG